MHIAQQEKLLPLIRGLRVDNHANEIFLVRINNYFWLMDHLPLIGKRIRFSRTAGRQGLIAEDIELE